MPGSLLWDLGDAAVTAVLHPYVRAPACLGAADIHLVARRTESTQASESASHDRCSTRQRAVLGSEQAMPGSCFEVSTEAA